MKSRIFMLAAAASVLTFVSTVSFGQGVPAGDARPQETPKPAVSKPAAAKPNLMAQLDLTPEQVQQIRRINVERKPLAEAAQARFRAANRALDEAIYSDQTDEADVDAKIKEVQAAQSELIRMRSANELAVRKVLTPEQLTKFKLLRQRFEEIRQTIETRRRNNIGPRQNGIRPGRPIMKQTPPPGTR